ncbi:MAG: hypothetical protein FJY16_06640 [Bacteroidetes bacterium]|nr:hypothetical protein [Bacteroidota bacterium]
MHTSSSRFLTTAVILLLLINTGLVIYLVLDRNRSHRSYNRERPDISALFAKEMDLSVAQAQQHRILHEAHFKRVGVLYDSIRLVKIALFTTATLSTADSLLLLSNQKINNWHVAINAQTVSHMQKVKDMLTDEQKKKYDQFIIKMMQRGHRDSNRGH